MRWYYCMLLHVQPMYATHVIFRTTQMNVTVWYFVYNTVRGTRTYTLCGVTVLESTATGVDRLLALLLGLGYRHVVTY